jgi:hypothetical protein
LGHAVLLTWAVLGTALSAALHVYTFAAGYRPVANARVVLLASAIGLIFFALVARRHQRARRATARETARETARQWWKAAEDASPYWLRWVSRAAILYMAGFFAYDAFTALTATVTPEAATREADRILGALFAAFHAITFTLVYTSRIASRQSRGDDADPSAG